VPGSMASDRSATATFVSYTFLTCSN
jgi:hypothetical protein